MTYSGKLLFGALVNYSLVVVMWLLIYIPARGVLPGWVVGISLLLLVAIGALAFYRAMSAIGGLAQPLERVTHALESIARGEIATDIEAAATGDMVGRLQNSC